MTLLTYHQLSTYETKMENSLARILRRDYRYYLIRLFIGVLTVYCCLQALLETEAEVQQWLHTGALKSKETLSLLSPRLCIDLYPVNKSVNSVSTNGPSCILKSGLNKEDQLSKDCE